MGQARITSGGPDGLYNITLIKHAAKSATELTAIGIRLTALTGLITAADDKIATELAALAPLQNALSAAMILLDGTAATIKVVTDAQKALMSKQTDVIKAQSALSLLKAEEESIKKRQTMLTAAMASEHRPAWCTDLTEDITAGTVVGTMEMNGVDDEIIIAPGGAVSESIGLLQHVGVSTGAAVFCNRARLPAWQKWKPTYRVGRIITINYESNICDVGIEEQYSEEQGLKINQAGTLYTALKAAISGWDDFAAKNPSFDLVTNTSDSTILSTDQLLADLNTVNNYVNSRYRYALDEQQYGKLENWTIMAEGGSGDCEDFSLTKASKLLALGYPASALHIEVGMYSGEGHAWLVVQTDNGDLALDNRYQSVMKNTATPYYARQRQIGMEWKVRGVLLADVPIEYMNGDNASAFLTDDMVVVQFIGQNWDNPKVIGFETNPSAGLMVFVKYYDQQATEYRVKVITQKGVAGADKNITPGIMQATPNQKGLVVARYSGFDTILTLDLYSANSKKTFNCDLWVAPISTYFASHGLTKGECYISSVGCIFFNSYNQTHATIYMKGGSVLTHYVAGFVVIDSITGLVVSAYAHDYGAGLFYSPIPMPGGYIANGRIYLADRSNGVDGKSILRILGEWDHQIKEDLALDDFSSQHDFALAVHATTDKIYCIYVSQSQTVYLKIFNISYSEPPIIQTTTLARTVVVYNGFISNAWASIIVRDKLRIYLLIAGYTTETTMYTFSLDGDLASSLSLGNIYYEDFSLAESNIV